MKKKLVLIAALLCASLSAQAQIISTICGTGTFTYSGDGGPALAAEIYASYSQIATDGLGNIYIADNSNSRIRKIDAVTGIINTICGTGTSGYSGDGGPAISAEINSVYGICVDLLNNIYFSDYNEYVIRKINPSGIITTIAGDGTDASTGNGDSAIFASISGPAHLGIDASGNIYFAEYGGNRVRRISSTGIITTVLGDGSATNTGNGSLASAATIHQPWALDVDRASGDVYVAAISSIDDGAQVRKIASGTGIVTAVAGTGVNGYSGDGGLATSAEVSAILAIVVKNGLIYFSDADNYVVRKVNAAGIISNFVGTSVLGYSGDGALATLAEIDYVYGLAFDGCNIYLNDGGGSYIRKVTSTPATVSFSAFPILCDYSPALTLTQASPVGGVYSGNGVTGNQFDPSVPGVGTTTITYSYTDGNGCASSPAIIDVLVDACASITETAATKVDIYPNPSTGIVNVIPNSTSITAVLIYNYLGKLVYESNKEVTAIDLSEFPNGVYSFKVVMENSVLNVPVLLNK